MTIWYGTIRTFAVDREAITDGPVGRVLSLLAAPIVAQNLVYVSNVFVNTFWLRRVSGDVAAAHSYRDDAD